MIYLRQIVNNLLAIEDLNFTNIQIQGACAPLAPPPRTPVYVAIVTRYFSRCRTPLSTAKAISTAPVRSHRDYYSSILSNTAKSDVFKHCLARVVLRALRLSPSLPLLKQCHCFPITCRIKRKLSTLTYRIHIYTTFIICC